SKAYKEFGFELKNTLIGANGTIRCLNLLDSTLLTSGSDDSYFRVWNLKENKVRDSFGKDNGGHSNQIRDLISIDKDYMSTASLDGSIKIWRVTHKETKLIKTLDSTNGGHTQGVLRLAALDNNLVSVSVDKTVKIWDIKNLDQIKIKYTFDSSKDGHSGMNNGGHEGLIFDLANLGNSGKIASVAADKIIKIWNVEL
ncbi:unnamed protein product, partial [Brachionus calyciflorus]